MADELKAAEPLFPPDNASQPEAWFREQVEIGLKEANDPKTIWHTQEEVFRELKEHRELWRRTPSEERDAA